MRSNWWSTAVAAAALWLATADARAEEIRGTFPFDPVEICGGKEVAGKEEISTTHWKYRYIFTSDENKRTFQADPERYAIQMAGGCGRMGALSGEGHVALHAVHDGKLYIFASDQCRKAFLSTPERMLEVDDPPPPANAEAAKRGRELLDKVVAFMGGAKPVDAVRTYETSFARVLERDGKKTSTGKTKFVAFPDKLRREEHSDEWRIAYVSNADEGFIVLSEKVEPMHPVQVRAHTKPFEHDLLVLMRSRHRPDFKVALTGAAKIDDTPTELVTVWFDGTATTLAVHSESGNVERVTYRGRGPRIFFGTVDHRIMEYREVAGVKVPIKTQASFDGERVDAMDVVLDVVKINEDVPAGAFDRPDRG